MGADHVVLPAFLRKQKRRLGGAGGPRRRGFHAGEILVGGAAGRARDRGARRSPPCALFPLAGPFITVAVGAAALAPHIWWLYANGFAAFGYALESHPATFAEALLSGVTYVASAAGYVAVPVLIAAIAARPSAFAVADTLWPSDPPRRTVVIAFALPLLLPVVAAVLAKEKVVPIWTIASMTLLPVVLLSSPLVTLVRAAAIRILAIAIAATGGMCRRRVVLA